MWPTRDETLRLMGMEDTQWKEASSLWGLLSTLKQQREKDADQKDVKGERTGYFYAALSIFRYTFHTPTGPFYDKKRKCLWYLGWRGPKQPEYPELDIRATYYIVQESRYLCVYADRKRRSKSIARFDMLNPEDRQGFVNVKRLIATKYPQTSSPPKHKSLARVLRIHGGHRNSGILVEKTPLKNNSLRKIRRTHSEGYRKSRLVEEMSVAVEGDWGTEDEH